MNLFSAGGERRGAVLLAALMLLWCVGLFGRGIWTPDEPREAALAASVSEHPAALPSLAGVRFAEKPPLTYWLSGGAMRLFGAHPAAARLPQLAYALLGLFAVLALTRRLLGIDSAGGAAAPAAALVFASGALAYQVQIWLDTDALLLAGVALALAGMYSGLNTSDAAGPSTRARLRAYLVMHLGLTLAFFAKNFAAWLVPALAFLCFISWERRWRELARWELYLGGLLPVACIAAWATAVAVQPDGAQALRILFWNNLVGRALPMATEQGLNYSSGHSNWPGKYLVELPLYLLPWTALAVPALGAAYRGARRADPRRSAWRFALCAALPGLLLLSLASTARGIYAAPCMIGFALLIALWVSETADARRALALTAVLIALSATIVLTLTLALQWTVERANSPAFLLSALSATAVLVWSLRQGLEPARPLSRSVLQLAVAWSLLLSLGVCSLIGAVNRTQDLPALASRVAQLAGSSPLLLWSPDETTLAWAQLYLPAGSWSAVDGADVHASDLLAHRLGAAPGLLVVSMVPGKGWSRVKWREYLRGTKATTALSMLPMAQARGEKPLADAGLVVTTRVERPGGRGYFLWRLRRRDPSAVQGSES